MGAEGLHCLSFAMLCYAKSLQLCPTLCDPRDGSKPGSSIHGIFQASVLEWGAIAFSGLTFRITQNSTRCMPCFFFLFFFNLVNKKFSLVFPETFDQSETRPP